MIRRSVQMSAFKDNAAFESFSFDYLNLHVFKYHDMYLSLHVS